MTIKKKVETLRTSPATSSYSETSGIEAETLVPEVSPHLDDPDDAVSEDSSPVVVFRETRKRWTAEQKLSIIRLDLSGRKYSFLCSSAVWHIPCDAFCLEIKGEERVTDIRAQRR